MDRIWQAQYLPSMKKEILLAYDSLVDIIQESIRKYSDKVAYSNFGGKRTYEEVGKLSRDFAAYLQSELGVKKGDRIALMAPNCMAFSLFHQVKRSFTIFSDIHGLLCILMK